MATKKTKAKASNRDLLLQILQNQGAMMLFMHMQCNGYGNNLLVKMNLSSLNESIQATSNIYNKNKIKVREVRR